MANVQKYLRYQEFPRNLRGDALSRSLRAGKGSVGWTMTSLDRLEAFGAIWLSSSCLAVEVTPRIDNRRWYSSQWVNGDFFAQGDVSRGFL